uniref:Uncharacterized protein n=1 Tax=Arundo donax TaxID=35708 RepID=A0A0A9GR72_ARUDO
MGATGKRLVLSGACWSKTCDQTRPPCLAFSSLWPTRSCFTMAWKPIASS